MEHFQGNTVLLEPSNSNNLSKSTLLSQLQTKKILTNSVIIVDTRPGERITFLDTPGHAAFERVRKCGASVTDIIILVIDFQDSLQPQTIESLRLARGAGIPLIIAISKCDGLLPAQGTSTRSSSSNGDSRHSLNFSEEVKKDFSNSRKITREASIPKLVQEKIEEISKELARHGVYTECYGGETQIVPFSGLTGWNVGLLLESIAAQTEMMDLQFNPDSPFSGTVIEAQNVHGLGITATIISQDGVHLKSGMLLFAEGAVCKVRSLHDEHGQLVKEVGPSVPVTVSGWRKIPPPVGAQVRQVTSESELDFLSEKFQLNKENSQIKNRNIIAKRLENIYERIREEKSRKDLPRSQPRLNIFYYDEAEILNDSTKNYLEVPFLIKCDVSGSIDAVKKLVEEGCGGKRVKARIISCTTGPFTSEEALLAQTASAIVYSFGLKVPFNSGVLAQFGIQLRHFDVIYRLQEAVNAALLASLPSKIKETKIGTASVLQTFSSAKGCDEEIIGCKIIDGIFRTNSEQLSYFSVSHRKQKEIKIPRYIVTVGELTSGEVHAHIKSMRHFKNEINLASKGMECGIVLNNCSTLPSPGHYLYCFDRTIIPPSLD